MNLLAPGTLPWLLRHELRIEWRELTMQRGRGTAIAIGLAVTAGLVWLWSLVLSNLLLPVLKPSLAPEAFMVAGMMLYALLPVAVMLGMNQSVKAVFERNDMDLLLQSPLPVRLVFASRLLGVVTYVFLVIGVFVLPLAIAGLLNGIPRLLGVIPVLLVLAMVGGALGMLLTLLLVRLMGAWRARVASQVLAAVAGAGVFVAFQVWAFTDGDGGQLETVSSLLPLLQPGGPLALDSGIWLPGRALFLDPVPTVVLLLAGVALIALATVLLRRWFVLGVSASASAVGRRGRRSNRPLKFSGRTTVWQVMLAKDWRVLVRDPYLLSNTLLQLLYLLPLGFVIFYDQGEFRDQLPLVAFAAAAMTVLAGTLAANLARICMAGEEAMDLLVSSPVTIHQLQLAKLLAALVPVWLLFVPLSVGAIFVDPRAGITALALVLLATLSVAYLRLMNPHRANRQDLFKRKGQGDQVLFLLESIIPLVLGLAAWMLATANPWGWLTLFIGVLMPVLAIVRGRNLGSAYGEQAFD